MKPRTLLVLALVVGALAAAVLLYERDLPSTDERSAKAKKIVPVASEDLVALDIEWQGKKVRLERDAKPPEATAAGAAFSPPRKWRMLEPFPTTADSSAVDSLAGQLANLEVTRELAGAARADVGLEPPRGKVSWRTPAASGTLEIGGGVPASTEVVVASSERAAAVVVADSFVTQLEREPGEWRSREVVTAQRSEIERVSLETPGAVPVVLAKSGEALRLEAPVADVADREAVDQLFADLTALRIETFLDPPLTDNTTAALAAPAGKLELRIAGATEPITIELGGEPLPGKRIARAGGQAFVAATKLLDSVTRPSSDWRSRHWTRFENWRIERVNIDDAVGKLVLERKDGQWRRDGSEIPFSAASDLLYAITSAKAETVREEAAGSPAPGKPVLTLVLVDADGNEETLTLYAPGAVGVPARTSGRDLTLLLSPTVAGEVTSKLAVLRSVLPVTPPPATATPGSATPAP